MHFLPGIVIFLSSGILILCSLPIILIFHFDKEFHGNAVYTIMMILGVIDILQLVVHFYSGILIVAGIESLPFLINKIVGAVFSGLWYSMLATMLFLTYNRFSVIVLSRYRCCNSKIVKISWILFCFLNFLIPTLLKLLPGCNYFLDPTTLQWGSPVDDNILSQLIKIYDLYLLWAVVAASILAYIGAYLHMAIMLGGHAFRGKEWKITLQVGIIIAYFLFATFYWYYVKGIFQMDPILFNFLSSIVWIIMNGLHPVVYLIFNKRLRKSFKYLFLSLSPRGEMRNSAVAAVTPKRFVQERSSAHSTHLQSQ